LHLEGKNFIYVFLSAFLGTIVPCGIFAQGDESFSNQHFKTFIASDPISNNLAFYDVTSSTTKEGGQSFFLKNAAVSTRKNDITDLSTLGQIYIQNLKAELAIASNANDFIEQNLKLSNYGSSHITYAQSLNSIPVFGAEIMVHFDASGQLRGMNGLAYSLKATSKTSNVELQDALNNAVSHINGLTKAVYLNMGSMKYLSLLEM